MKTIGYNVDEFKGEYSVYCIKEDELGTDTSYEMTGNAAMTRKFLDSRGINAYFDNIQSYYEV